MPIPFPSKGSRVRVPQSAPLSPRKVADFLTKSALFGASGFFSKPTEIPLTSPCYPSEGATKGATSKITRAPWAGFPGFIDAPLSRKAPQPPFSFCTSGPQPYVSTPLHVRTRGIGGKGGPTHARRRPACIPGIDRSTKAKTDNPVLIGAESPQGSTNGRKAWGENPRWYNLRHLAGVIKTGTTSSHTAPFFYPFCRLKKTDLP